MRTRFAVHEDGFTPPFATISQALRREQPFVPYTSFARANYRQYVRAGEPRIDEVSIELADGRRLLVREADVGQEGLRALLQASEEYRQRALRGEVPGPLPVSEGPVPRVPPWIRRELRLRLLEIGLVLLGILLFFSLFLLLPGLIGSGWQILVPLVILSLGVPVLLVMAYQAWRRAVDLTEERERGGDRHEDEWS